MCLGHPVVERKMLVFLALVPHRLKSDGGFPSQISSRKEGFILYLNLLYLIFLLWPRRCCLGKTGLLKARSSSAALRCFLVRSSVRRKKKRQGDLTLILWRNCFEDELRSAGCSDSTLKSTTARSSMVEITNTHAPGEGGTDHVLQCCEGVPGV